MVSYPALSPRQFEGSHCWLSMYQLGGPVMAGLGEPDGQAPAHFAPGLALTLAKMFAAPSCGELDGWAFGAPQAVSTTRTRATIRLFRCTGR